MKRLTFLALCAAALAFSLPALAEHPGHGHGHGHGKHHDEDQQGDDHDEGRRGFEDRDRDEIRGWYEANPGERERLPPGLAKKHKIPPGWEKKIGRGQRIPDDVWEHRVPVPHDVILKLPVPPPPGVVLVRVENHVLKVVEKTHEVLDDLGLPHPPTPRLPGTRQTPPR